MVDDLVRSVMVKNFRSVEGGDVEQWLEPRKYHRVCDCLLFLSSLFSLFTYLHTYNVYLFASILCVVIGIF